MLKNLTAFLLLNNRSTNNTSKTNRSEDKLQHLDFIALCFLVFTLSGYQVQYALPAFKTLHVRELIYAYLYFRVALKYSAPQNWQFKILILYFTITLGIAIYTWREVGLIVAVASFTRFNNVALLAPLVAILITRESQLLPLIYLWVCIVIIGFVTIFTQLVGFELNWLLGKYIAMRGGLVRYKSLLGEPNAGGLAGVILFVLTLVYVNRSSAKIACIGVAIFLIVFSLSKAAVILFAIAFFIFSIAEVLRRFIFQHNFLPANLSASLLVAIFWLAAISTFPIGQKYIEVGVSALIGRDEESPSAWVDLVNRTSPVSNTTNTSRFVSDRNFIIATEGAINFFFGRSYAGAGSAAVDLGVPGAFLPHNMYKEVLVVGGFLLLSVFSLLIFFGFIKLCKSFLENKIYIGILAMPLFINALAMMGFPIIYEPISGLILWLALGVSASHLIDKSSKV
jgi:hypothetical protein